MQQEIEIIDRFGRKRRARRGEVIAEGERIHFPATLMDAMARVMMTDSTDADRTIRDAHGTPSGHTPGYAFAPPNVPLRDAATQAYEERCERLADAWRHRGQVDGRMHEPAHTRDATQLTTDAEQAWQDEKQRLDQAWRRHRA